LPIIINTFILKYASIKIVRIITITIIENGEYINEEEEEDDNEEEDNEEDGV